MPEKRKLSRRRVLKHALAATATGMTLPALASCSNKTPSAPEASSTPQPTPGPNDQIGVGIIGCGRRNAQLQIGRGDQGKPPPAARIVAVADLNLTRARQWGEKHRAEVYQDYRKMLGAMTSMSSSMRRPNIGTICLAFMHARPARTSMANNRLATRSLRGG